MPAREGRWLVPFEPSPGTVIRIGWISAALGFLIAIASGIGEALGWWDLLGGRGMTVGSLLGIVATFTTLSFTAGRDQVTAVRETIESVDEGMTSVEEGIASVEEGIATVDETTARNNQILQANNETLVDAAVTLDGIEDALVQQDGETSKLDVVQAELDRQTGVLGRQVELLAWIRDGL